MKTKISVDFQICVTVPLIYFWSILPPENTRKPMAFCCPQGRYKIDTLGRNGLKTIYVLKLGFVCTDFHDKKVAPSKSSIC